MLLILLLLLERRLLLERKETAAVGPQLSVGEETAEEANVIMRRPCFVCQSTRLLYAVVLILTRVSRVQLIWRLMFQQLLRTLKL